MRDLIAAFIGVLISLMITANNKMSASTGVYSSSVIIHTVGVLCSLAFLLIARTKITFGKTSLYMFTGGLIGIGNVVFANFSIPALGVSLVVSFALLGQVLTSMTFDIFGLMGSIKEKPNLKSIIGLFIMAIGIIIMFYY